MATPVIRGLVLHPWNESPRPKDISPSSPSIAADVMLRHRQRTEGWSRSWVFGISKLGHGKAAEAGLHGCKVECENITCTTRTDCCSKLLDFKMFEGGVLILSPGF